MLTQLTVILYSFILHADSKLNCFDERQAMVMRIEELRTRTDSMVVQSLLRQAEAAVISAEANPLPS